ncbi:Alpha/Beta hydrolase protein [Xylariaceae sp. FL0016]|nr:Alpha/Beta hydrolase protein [Xylariaceae sp. FL0016]
MADRSEVTASTERETPQHRLLVPEPADPSSDANTGSAPSPLIICFHGSGESCSPSWDALAAQLVRQTRLRVLLYERGPSNPRPEEATAALRAYLETIDSRSSRDTENLCREKGMRDGYLLVAHSYGGAFARAFMRVELASVVGAVLVETGQEGGLDPKVGAAQLRRCVMGDRPLCVVRGNTLIGKWKQLEENERAARASGDEARLEALRAERTMLRMSDEEDERLKRAQLRLSRRHEFVVLRDVGHHVVRDRPDEIVRAVQWVLDHPVPMRRGKWWSRVLEKVSLISR